MSGTRARQGGSQEGAHGDNQQYRILSSTRITTTKKTGPRDDVKENNGSDSEDPDDPDYESDSGSAEADGDIPQLPVPGLPKVGERFRSADDLLIQGYRAVIPVYGIGVKLVESKGTAVLMCGRSNSAYRTAPGGRCPWRLNATVDSSTGEVVVVGDGSHASSDHPATHNHGPNRKILENRDYRPPIFHPAVRRAFGLAPLVTRPRRRAPFSAPNPPAQKKLKRHAVPAGGASSIPSPPADPFTPPSRSPLFPVPSTAAITFPLDETVSQPIPSFGSVPPGRSPHPRRSFDPSPSSSSSFYPHLEAFLDALAHGRPDDSSTSFASLAHPLFDLAGITSFELLANACALAPSTFARFSLALAAREQEQEQQGAAGGVAAVEDRARVFATLGRAIRDSFALETGGGGGGGGKV
ncbi:hypothetical protein JCM11491_004705 [Sporobolomyces phaffii]